MESLGDDELTVDVARGHRYWVLDGRKLSQDDIVLLSSRMNTDQMQNHGYTISDMVGDVDDVVRKLRLALKCDHIPLAHIMAELHQHSIVQIKPDIAAQVGRFVCALGGGKHYSYVPEWLSFIAGHVNPLELACPPSVLEKVAAIEIDGENGAIFKNLFIQVAYDPSVVEVQVRPIPDKTKFLGVPEINNVGKRITLAKEFAALLLGTRLELAPLKRDMPTDAAFWKFLRPFEHNVIRLLTGKELLKDYPIGSSVVGVPTIEKAKQLRAHFVKHASTADAEMATVLKTTAFMDDCLDEDAVDHEVFKCRRR